MRLGLVRLHCALGGGAEHSLRMLAAGLSARGHEVHVLTSFWEGPAVPGIEPRLLPAPGKGAARILAFARAAAQARRELGLDVCLSLERLPESQVFRAGDGVHAAWLARRAPYESRLKRLSFRFNPLHRALLDLERRTLTSSALVRVIANSRLVAQELEEHYGLGPDKVTVIHNAVNEGALGAWRGEEARQRARQELALSDEQPTLLFLGSGFERKGLAFAIGALPLLPQAILLVAGRDRTAPYQRLASRLGVARRVRFLGRRDDAPRLLAAADALVLPTIYDPCANSCLEALYLGLPVVTTTANGAQDFVVSGENGFLLAEPADAEALAQAISQALALSRPTPHDLPRQEQWLERTEQALMQAAGR